MLKRQLYNVLHGSSSSSSSSEDDDDDSQSEGNGGESPEPAPSEDEEEDEQKESPRKINMPVEPDKPREEKLVLLIKGVYKCKLCPKTICFSEASIQDHLKSKGHARSLKQRAKGRLKTTLNSDGEEEVIESDGETHAERHARILALAQKERTEKNAENKKKKTSGRQRQRKRTKLKATSS